MVNFRVVQDELYRKNQETIGSLVAESRVSTLSLEVTYPFPIPPALVSAVGFRKQRRLRPSNTSTIWGLRQKNHDGKVAYCNDTG